MLEDLYSTKDTPSNKTTADMIKNKLSNIEEMLLG